MIYLNFYIEISIIKYINLLNKLKQQIWKTNF